MAEIIAEPTALSKVIALKFKINDVDVPKTTQLPTNKQFNTTDTDAWFTFELDGLASTSGTYDLTLINLDDKSIFHHADVLFAALPFHYKLNSSDDVTLNEIRHAGRWLGQLVVTMANGDTTARQFGFNIAGHILDGQDAQVILLSDYQALINTINLYKDDLAQYNVDYAALIADVDAKEALRQQAEIDRAAVFAALVESEMVAQNVATKLTEKEATFAPRILSVEQQLEQVEVTKATKIELQAVASGSPKGTFATLVALQAAYPTGNTNIYVVTADGNWYYWNGTTWTSGGAYQSTGIADKSIKPIKLSDLSSRAFDYEKSHLGYGFSKILNLNFVIGTLNSTGIFTTNSYNVVSDFFTLEDVITLQSLNVGVTFKLYKYNASQVFVSSHGFYGVQTELPNDAAWYRLVISNGAIVADTNAVNYLVDSVIVGVGKTNEIKSMKAITDYVDGKIVKSANLLDPEKMVNGYLGYTQGTSLITDITAGGAWWVTEIFDFADFSGKTIICPLTVKARYYNSSNVLSGTTVGVWDSVNLYNTLQIPTGTYPKVRFEIERYNEATAVMSFSDEYVGFIPYGYYLDRDILVRRIEDLEKDNRALYLPDELYVSKGNKVTIPYASFVSAPSPINVLLKSTAADGKYKLLTDKFVKSIVQDDGDWFNMYDPLTDELLDSKYTLFKCADYTTKPNPTETKTLLVIGDSFIQAGVILDDIKAALTQYAYSNVKMIGNTTVTDTGNGVPHAGAGGYRAYDFITDPALLRPQFPNNPFWNSATGEVDFANYIATLGETTLDYVIIHLGINDKLTDGLTGDTGNQTIVDRITTLVNYIHADFPNCKVLVNGLVILSKYNNYANFKMYADDIFKYNKLLEDTLGNLPNTIYIPIVTTFDSDFAYLYTMQSAYRGSDETYKVVTEWLHPSAVGYHMIADQDIAAFVYHM